jgi:ribosomal protein L7/L12
VSPSPEHIDELLRAGQKIEAIKAYRALHGVGLKEAKDAIDARSRNL